MAFLPMIGMAAGALGAGVSAFGAIQGGRAQSAMYNYQSGVAQINKQIAEQNAIRATETGEVEAQRSGMKSRYQMGLARAGLGASGLDVNRGSAVDVQAGMKDVALLDQATIRDRAAMQRRGYEVEMTKQEAQSQLYRGAGQQAKTASYIDAVGSILGGVSSVAGKWQQAKLYNLV